MSNAFGPFTLQPYEQMALLTHGEKIVLGHRRRAVSGPAEDKGSDEGDDDDRDSLPSDAEEGEDLPLPEIELPGVGLGRGSKGMEDNVLQPVSFHSLPPLVAESLAHSVWETGVLV